MILSQQTKITLVQLAKEMGIDSAVKGLSKKKRGELIELITKRACTNEEYMKMITPEPVVIEPVDNSNKISCAKYTIEFNNRSTASVTFRKEDDGGWTVMRASKRLNWMLQPKRTWDRKWSADDKTPRKLISEVPREMSEIRDFVLSHKHEVETFTIDA